MSRARDTPWVRAVFVTAVAAIAALLPQAQGAISYSTPGSLYTETFDGLPTAGVTNNNALQPSPYTLGWQDDNMTMPTLWVSVPGWYLYHELTPTDGEWGANNHQRFRMGTGMNTGSFWGFGLGTAAADKALGSLGSTVVQSDNTSMYIALRLTNTTGATLNSFTLTYDGEEWRDGASPTGETMVFDYSLRATPADWFNPATAFTPVSALNYTSPVVASTTGAPVNGNIEGKVANRTATVTGISWAPGTDLWLRWGDNSLPTLADDGLGIDNVRFLAVPEPAGAAIVSLGAVAAFARRRRI